MFDSEGDVAERVESSLRAGLGKISYKIARLKLSQKLLSSTKKGRFSCYSYEAEIQSDVAESQRIRSNMVARSGQIFAVNKIVQLQRNTNFCLCMNGAHFPFTAGSWNSFSQSSCEAGCKPELEVTYLFLKMFRPHRKIESSVTSVWVKRIILRQGVTQAEI